VRLRLSYRVLENGYIEGEGRIGPPLDCASRYFDEVIGVWQRLAQPGEQRTEVLARLLVRGVWPEEKRELFAGERGGSVQHKVGEQVLEARLVKARRGSAVIQQAKRAKQMNLKVDRGHRLRPSGSGRSTASCALSIMTRTACPRQSTHNA